MFNPILRIAHYLLSHDTTYQEQELVYLDERRRARTQQRALDQLKALGYDVALTPKVPAAWPQGRFSGEMSILWRRRCVRGGRRG